MNFKSIMIIKALVCLTFAPLFLFVPGWLLELFGTSFGPGAALTARMYGATLAGNLFLTWLARNEAKTIARNAITWQMFIYDAVGFIATLIIVLTGKFSLLGWGIVVVYLFFTLSFGYFLIPQGKTELNPR